MSKRFIDTTLWDRPWFMELVPSEKLAFYYIISQCNNVGVWAANFRLAEFQIGTQLDWEKFAGKCHGNIFILSEYKWFIVDYVKFQHPDFNASYETSKNNAVKSYARELSNDGLLLSYLDYLESGSFQLNLGASEGRPTPPRIGTGKERVKEEVRERARKDTHELPDGQLVPINLTTHQSIVDKYGLSVIEDYYEKISDFSASHNRKYVDYSATARNWIKDDISKGKAPKRNPSTPTPLSETDLLMDELLKRKRGE
jgi:hypothetical protein